MKLETITIHNFRCYERLCVDFGSMHALVGANNAGKSTVLHALDFLFNPSTKRIDEESFCGKQIHLPIEVEAIFSDLSTVEAEKLASYLRPDGKFHIKRFVKSSVSPAADDDKEDSKLELGASYCKPMPKIEWLNSSKITTRTIAEWWPKRKDLVVNEQEFQTHLGSSRPGVRDWQQAASEFAEKYLTASDYEASWIDNPVGYPNVLKAMLPHFVLIPAVREATDESKVTKTSPFGKLVYEILDGLDGPLREKLETSLRNTTRLLNRSGESERAPGVVTVENTINAFLRELMPVDLELQFQAPTIEVLLTTPKLIIDDGFKGAVEGKGHGLQRAVIFSILRAYAQLIATRGADRRTLILGVEEPEVYMHPTAQRTIRKVLRSIADAGDQVIFTTHSPLLVDVAYFDEIIRCESPENKRAGVEWTSSSKRFQLSMRALIEDLVARHSSATPTELSMRELYSAAYTQTRNEGFFAKRIILVEGETEIYALPIYAAAMGMDLDVLGISVIECGNKAQIERLYRIFNELGIPCYIVFDFDQSNTEAERRRESRTLLKLVDGPEVQAATVDAIEDRYAYFKETWEQNSIAEIPDYVKLKAEAMAAIGIKNERKPLVARYIANKLTKSEPPFVPPTLRKIIGKASAVTWRGTCLFPKVAKAV